MAMTAANERRYVEWYAVNLYREEGYGGTGGVADAGRPGLKHNRRLQQPARVEVYDRFQWDTVMESWVAGSPIAGRLKERGITKQSIVSRSRNTCRCFPSIMSI